MKTYRKPSCISQENVHGLVPLAAIAGVEALSAALSVTGAAVAGAAAGLALGGKDDFSLTANQAIQEQIVY